MCPWNFPGLQLAQCTLSLYNSDPYLDRVATDVTQATQSVEQSLMTLGEIHKYGLRRDLVDIDAIVSRQM